jgi:thioredoxin reductase (NADPH)
LDKGKIIVNGNLETNVPGIFAVGDIRQGSIGRIGTSVGDGQVAVRNVWDYFSRVGA